MGLDRIGTIHQPLAVLQIFSLTVALFWACMVISITIEEWRREVLAKDDCWF
jgi:hypothetical protein